MAFDSTDGEVSSVNPPLPFLMGGLSPQGWVVQKAEQGLSPGPFLASRPLGSASTKLSDKSTFTAWVTGLAKMPSLQAPCADPFLPSADLSP